MNDMCDARELARNMAAALSVADQMGEAARSKAGEFSDRENCQRLAEIIDRVIRQKKMGI